MRKKNKNSLNRREFVQRSGLALAAGLVLPALGAVGGADPAVPTAARNTDLERWMLQTGRGKIDEHVFRQLERQL